MRPLRRQRLRATTVRRALNSGVFRRGGVFTFTFVVPPVYPHEPPKVKCKTKARRLKRRPVVMRF